MNLGIGLGALTGGLIATTDSPGTFTRPLPARRGDVPRLRVRDARARARARPPRQRSCAAAAGSYREVLRHRPFVAVIALNALFIFAGFSGFDVLPVYAKNEAGLDETQIGLLFLVNTLVIVFTQLPIARLARGRRRMPTLALFGLLWAGAWLLVPIAGAAATSQTRVRRPRRRDGRVRDRPVPPRRRRRSACRRSRRAAAHGSVHGAERPLVADRVRARSCSRRRGARGVAERRLDRRGGALRDRRRMHAPRRGRAARTRARRTPVPAVAAT